MAVSMHPSIILPEKFEKLRFTEYVSDSMSIPSTPSTPCTPPTESYSIEVVTNEDKGAILDLLRRFFFRDEPLNVNIKLLDGKNPTCVELEQYSSKDLGDGLSLKAVSESGELIGVCLNGIMSRNEPEEHEEECLNPKFKKILDLLNHVSEQSNLFGKFPDVSKIMTVKILSVDGSWRGRGIAQELMNRTRDLAREQGCGLMTADCTSHYTARALKKLGFECIYTLKYEDYKVNGETVFNPENPHTAVTVYVQRIR